MKKFSITPGAVFRRIKENFSIAHFFPALHFHFWSLALNMSYREAMWLMFFSAAVLLWLAGILLCFGIKRAVWIHVGILLFFFVWALCPWDKFAMVIVLYFLWIPISMCAVWSLTRIIRAEEKRNTSQTPGDDPPV